MRGKAVGHIWKTYEVGLGCGHRQSYGEASPHQFDVVWCASCADYQAVTEGGTVMDGKGDYAPQGSRRGVR